MLIGNAAILGDARKDHRSSNGKRPRPARGEASHCPVCNYADGDTCGPFRETGFRGIDAHAGSGRLQPRCLRPSAIPWQLGQPPV